MLENFSNKLRRVVGIGAVAAGALTASSVDNRSETEKYTEPTGTEHIYTSSSKELSPINSVDAFLEKEFSKELSSKGYIQVQNVLNEFNPSNPEADRVISFELIKKNGMSDSVIITASPSVLQNKYSLQELAKEAVGSFLGTK